jgi:hypothetical protein
MDVSATAAPCFRLGTVAARLHDRAPRMSGSNGSATTPIGQRPLRLLPASAAVALQSAATEQWQVILRRSEGTVVLYNSSDHTLAVQKPVYGGYIEAGGSLPDADGAFSTKGRTPSNNTRSQTSCPLCRRPFPSYIPRQSPVPAHALLPGVPLADHISDTYFTHLSESHQNTPQILTPASSRPGTPDISSPPRSSRLDDSALLEGYYDRFFEELALLGTGMTGSVHLCQHVLNGNHLGLFACKKIPVGNSSTSLVKALKEIKNLESLRHPNIVAIHHVWLETVAISRGPPVPCLHALMAYANEGR